MSTYAYSKRGKELVQIIYKINIIYPWTLTRPQSSLRCLYSLIIY